MGTHTPTQCGTRLDSRSVLPGGSSVVTRKKGGRSSGSKPNRRRLSTLPSLTNNLEAFFDLRAKAHPFDARLDEKVRRFLSRESAAERRCTSFELCSHRLLPADASSATSRALFPRDLSSKVYHPVCTTLFKR
ncbi:hypothetical protein KM043_009397 [Ampulex compressa]|nr:hypothetical protein KM043_009397 [Ampulex compressa]